MINKYFLEKGFKIRGTEDIMPVLDEFSAVSIKGKKDLEAFIKDTAELYEKFSEDYAWTYINMTRDTNSKSYQEDFKLFNSKVKPVFTKKQFEFTKRIVQSEFAPLLCPEYDEMLARMRISVEIYNEDNIALGIEESDLSSKYQQIAGSTMVEFRGEKYTLSRMAKFLKSKDRNERKEAYDNSVKARLSIVSENDEIFNKLIALRVKMADNAGFDNYTDFRFKQMERLSYTLEDTKKFHKAVREVCVPIAGEILEQKRRVLGYDKLMPYDEYATAESGFDLVPFKTIEEFTDKSIEVLSRVDARFGDVLRKLKDMNYLDLENRTGKAPGGYNYPLLTSNIPFIFMNAVNIHADMRTLMHEAGHAVHTVSTADQFPYYYKDVPSETAELASMSMELLTMDKWDVFYDNEQALKQAKREQLEGILLFLPWCAIVDKFQNWLYDNPNHTIEERQNYFMKLANEYGEDAYDWTGYIEYHRNKWQRQIHIIEVPYYYIEYGIAQLGALQIWRNYLKNGKSAIDAYINALKAGSSLTIPAIYETAGISFDFSVETVDELMKFAFEEYRKLL